MSFTFGPRRASYVDITEVMAAGGPLTPAELAHFEAFDLLYRSLCALLFNYVPTSGHPGGSISSGRFVAAALFDAMDYELGDPDRPDADLISYAAGHKAMGLYAMWALRDEVGGGGRPGAAAREPGAAPPPGGPPRLPPQPDHRGRRCSASSAPGRSTGTRRRRPRSCRLATGASGVGVASSIGLGFGAADRYGADAPRVHIIEGEGGLTPGRVSRSAGRGRHRLARQPRAAPRLEPGVDRLGPRVPGGRPPRRLRAVGPARALLPARLERDRRGRRPRLPAGGRGPAPRAHPRHRAADGDRLPHAQGLALRRGGQGQPRRRAQALLRGLLRSARGAEPHDRRRDRPAHLRPGRLGRAPARTARACASAASGRRSRRSARRCTSSCRWRPRWRSGWRPPGTGSTRASGLPGPAPRASTTPTSWPRRRRRSPRRRRRRRAQLRLEPGTFTTLRGEFGRALHHLQAASGGAFLVAAADLMGSTSVDTIADGFPAGFWNARSNPEARLLSVGGICEDAIAGVLSGISRLRPRPRRRARPTAPSWRRSATSPRACTPSAPRRGGPRAASRTSR